MLELLLFALKDLRNSLKDLGSGLMIRFGRTETVIQDLLKEVSATNIYTQEEVEYDLRLVIENVKENLLGENSPEIFLWSTPLYDTKNMVDLPLSYDEFQRLNFNVHSPLSAPQLPGSAIDLAWGPLPTLDDLKEFMDESPYKLRGTWSSIKSSSAEKVLQNARNLISNGVTNGQSNMNSQTTRIKEKRVKNSAFVTKLGIFVGGGTNNVLNALAAYLRYLEGTARDDWQEVHARLRDAETREGASFGTLFGPALQLGIVSRRRVYYETIKYEKERNGGFLSPFGYSAASVAAVADHVCSREQLHKLLLSDSGIVFWLQEVKWIPRIDILLATGGGKYAVMGSKGPAVLLVHGFGAFLEHYRDNINDIVEGGNQVWAITLLGFGRSEKPNIVYTELMWAELLRDFIVDVVREPVHLVGNSFGGYFVSIVAGLWPDLAKSVVLLNSAGHYIPGYSSVPPSKERKTSGIAWLGARGISFYLRLSVRNLVKRCYPTITERADEGLLNEMSDDPGALVVLESIFTFDPSIPLNYLFKGFENKVLIIQGMKDPISDSKTKVNVVKKHFNEIVIKELDAGHCPHDEVPEEVNSIIREWVINTENRGEILKQSSKDESKVAA
ncbi:DNA photolyase [Artemisia annua]|uniref:DNA photolyase n=1 Tax=Artemisia annua TaxID=35608 RepID=A0A2U1LHT8_ARTAN|nr:DNA photolyase [Artemisia annua]